jgi:hypothetical protein
MVIAATSESERCIEVKQDFWKLVEIPVATTKSSKISLRQRAEARLARQRMRMGCIAEGCGMKNFVTLELCNKTGYIHRLMDMPGLYTLGKCFSTAGGSHMFPASSFRVRRVSIGPTTALDPHLSWPLVPYPFSRLYFLEAMEQRPTRESPCTSSTHYDPLQRTVSRWGGGRLRQASDEHEGLGGRTKAARMAGPAVRPAMAARVAGPVVPWPASHLPSAPSG